MKLNFITLTIILSLLIFLQDAAVADPVDIKDSLALVDFYNSTHGNNWFNHEKWLTKAPVSKWHNVDVSGNRVVEIYLSDNNLSGTIPESFGNLTALQNLYAFRNSLTGSLPSSIGNMASLVGIDLFSNSLSGSIPESIGNLSNLNFLYLNDNKLSGSIPESLGNLLNITNISLAQNKLTGDIPASLGNLTILNNLDLSYNKLTGNVPASLANIQLLRLILNDNRLSGDLTIVSRLTSLDHLDLGHNKLSGNIFPITNLINLNYLNLKDNDFTGKIPTALKKLTQLYFFNVSENRLTQDGNFEFGSNVNNLKVDISNNQFTFDGLESLRQNFKYPVYNPQAQLKINKQGNVLSVDAGGTLSNNTYYWYKAGSADSITIKGDSVFHPTQSGKYYAHITNAIVTYPKLEYMNLVLTTDTVQYKKTEITQSAALTVQTIKAADFSVYPNPAKDVLYVRVKGSTNVSLTNSAGKALLTKNINNYGNIQVSKFYSGTYYVRNNTTGETQKVVIAR